MSTKSTPFCVIHGVFWLPSDCVTWKPGWIHASTQNPARTPVHSLSASKRQNPLIVSFLPLLLWLSQSEGVGQAGSRWCGRAASSGWGYAGANRLLQCFGMWLLTHMFPVLPNRDSVKTSVAAPHGSSWDRSSRLLQCSDSAPPYPTFLSAVWLWVQLFWPQTCLCICSHSFVYVHSWKDNTETSTGTCSSCFGEKLAAFVCLCFSLCSQSCAGEAEMSMEWFAWRSLVQDKKEQSSREKCLCSAFY